MATTVRQGFRQASGIFLDTQTSVTVQDTRIRSIIYSQKSAAGSTNSFGFTIKGTKDLSSGEKTGVDIKIVGRHNTFDEIHFSNNGVKMYGPISVSVCAAFDSSTAIGIFYG